MWNANLWKVLHVLYKIKPSVHGKMNIQKAFLEMSYLGSKNLKGSAGYCLFTVAISSAYLQVKYECLRFQSDKIPTWIMPFKPFPNKL